ATVWSTVPSIVAPCGQAVLAGHPPVIERHEDAEQRAPCNRQQRGGPRGHALPRPQAQPHQASKGSGAEPAHQQRVAPEPQEGRRRHFDSHPPHQLPQRRGPVGLGDATARELAARGLDFLGMRHWISFSFARGYRRLAAQPHRMARQAHASAATAATGSLPGATTPSSICSRSESTLPTCTTTPATASAAPRLMNTVGIHATTAVAGERFPVPDMAAPPWPCPDDNAPASALQPPVDRGAVLDGARLDLDVEALAQQ